jgi:ATP-dependent DNA helicase DinG
MSEENDLPETASPGELFQPGGAVERAAGGFEPRRQQAVMADAVYKAVSGGTHLVAEAGTGVGKSLAYLVPAALWAVRNKKKVVVATHTKALQAQLVKKDLPVVRDILAGQNLPLNFFLIMGSANYLCLSRLWRAGEYTPELFDDDSSGKALEALLELVKTGETGCRPDLPIDVPQRVWAEVCRDPDTCLGRKCPQRAACFYRKEVERAKQADILVVNQHLFFAGMPIPAWNAAIFDEAHNLEEVASAFLGYSLSDRRVKRLLDDIFSRRGRGLAARLKRPPAHWVPAIKEAVGEAAKAAHDFFNEVHMALGADAKGVPLRARRVRKPGLAANTLAGPLLAVAGLLNEALLHSASAEEEADIKGCYLRCLAVIEQVANFLECKSAGSAYWLAASGGRIPVVSLHMAPVNVAEALRKELFGRGFPVVLTSATLAVDGTFTMVRGRLGLDKAAELLLDSPFDYRGQAVLYVPRSIPDPSAEPQPYEAALIEECSALAEAVSGGIFLLFTSWQALQRAYAGLAGRMGGRPLYRQGDKLPQQLLAEFRRAGNGVLFGTDTFWQGVDVSGQALACVAIARLPFTSPDTPLEEARHEWLAARGVNVFEEYTLPKAVVKFRQGFGRLIRGKSDYGAVVVLDPRVDTRSYGPRFLRSIPPCPRVTSHLQIRAFFAAKD